MALLPTKFQNTDDMPMSLGNAIALEIAPRKSDPIEAFNKGQHSHIAFNSATKTCLLTPISEKDCRQIKGAAKASSPSKGPTAEKVGISRPLPEAAPPVAQKFKRGDRVQYTREVLSREDFPPRQTQRTVSWCDGSRVEYAEGGWDPVNHLELIPATEPAATPVALGDGWIEWRGGECPIPLGTLVDVKLRDGSAYTRQSALSLDMANWSQWIESAACPQFTIAAYKVLA